MSDQNIDDLVTEARQRCRQREINRHIEPEAECGKLNTSSPILAGVFSAWGILNLVLAGIFLVVWFCMIFKSESPGKWFWGSFSAAAGAVVCFGIAEFFRIIGRIADNSDAIRTSLKMISRHFEKSN